MAIAVGISLIIFAGVLWFREDHSKMAPFVLTAGVVLILDKLL